MELLKIILIHSGPALAARCGFSYWLLVMEQAIDKFYIVLERGQIVKDTTIKLPYFNKSLTIN